jgi:hypothetical protein
VPRAPKTANVTLVLDIPPFGRLRFSAGLVLVKIKTRWGIKGLQTLVKPS